MYLSLFTIWYYRMLGYCMGTNRVVVWSNACRAWILVKGHTFWHVNPDQEASHDDESLPFESIRAHPIGSYIDLHMHNTHKTHKTPLVSISHTRLFLFNFCAVKVATHNKARVIAEIWHCQFGNYTNQQCATWTRKLIPKANSWDEAIQSTNREREKETKKHALVFNVAPGDGHAFPHYHRLQGGYSRKLVFDSK